MLKKLVFITIVCSLFSLHSCNLLNNIFIPDEKQIGELSSGLTFFTEKISGDQWGIAIREGDSVLWSQSHPVRLEHYMDSIPDSTPEAGYDQIRFTEQGFTGSATLTIGEVSFHVSDSWTITGEQLQAERRLQVSGNGPGGFLSSLTLESPVNEETYKYFAPGMIYGDPAYISPDAIGGKNSGRETWIREDRLPAPLFGAFVADGRSLSILNPDPQGHTTREDSHDREVRLLVDERFRFGSLGAAMKNDSICLGIKYPGSEGGTTYRGYFYPGGQVHRWRQRFHPLKDGLEQHYSVVFRPEQDDDFASYYQRAWRWAWETLQPQVNWQDIDLVCKHISEMLAAQVTTYKGITGLSNMVSFEEGVSGNTDYIPFKRTVMGFTGKALESANYLLQAADQPGNEHADEFRTKANDIINTFLRLKLSPPEGEGFYWQNATPTPALPRNRPLYIRSFGDGLKALLRAANRERSRGREHPEWIAWPRSFADWLLPQQEENGGFPRGWIPGTGEVGDSSLQSTYNAIPMLVLLSELTGEKKYLEAALKAGEFAWNNGQSEGIFVGGTIDNPNVVDKEAGTLSLEAYLALYENTQDDKWMKRAEMAASFAETWIYIWDVPMPEDERDEDLHWKRGIPTTGLQLISTGHSLVDAYMAFDADEYGKLFKMTGDPHYREVSRILLHNTKGMVALPGRLYDLPGPGWQQEHWSLAPERGIGRKRAWLPWVATSQLNGIFGLKEFDEELYKEMTAKN